MPGIWNINGGYNVNTKKVSSKLTFEVGERFTGRVVAKGDGKDVTIKLADGWQFVAELEGNVNLDDIKLVKFQVDGFKEGKLNLKLVQGTSDDETSTDENFQEVIEKEGLSKDDIDVLKKMVKHNISLTRDNINEIKGLIQFNGKMASKPKEIDAFIQTYLQSKDIEVNSEQGQVTKELLTKFLDGFKNMTPDDILAFIENNLDFSEENINSFNKLFKGGSSIEEILTKISDSLNELDISDNIADNDVEFIKSNLDFSEENINSFNKLFKGRPSIEAILTKMSDSLNELDISESIEDNNVKIVMNDKLINKEVDLDKNTIDKTTTLASKLYNENDPKTKKINILDVLRTLAGNEDSELDVVQKNAGKEISNDKKVNLQTPLINKLDNKEVVKLIKDIIGSSLKINDAPKTQAEHLIESTNKTKLEVIFSTVEGKDVKLTDNEFNSFKKELITKFLDEFKNMSSDDMLEFIENNLDFSEEDMNSFNKLFKGGSSKEEILTKVSDSLNKLDISDSTADNNVESVMNNKLINKEVDLGKNIIDKTTTLASKVYNENDLSTKKINIVDILRTLAGSEDSELDMVQKNASKESSNVEKLKLPASLIEKLDNKEIVKLIKDTIGNSLTTNDLPKTQAQSLIEATNKTKLEGLLSNIDGKNVKLTDSEFRVFKQLLNDKIEGKEVLKENVNNVNNDNNVIKPKEVSLNSVKETVEIKENLGKLNSNDLVRGNLDNKEAIKMDMKNKIENVRDIVKNIINQTELKDAGYEKIMNLVKANINDIKVFNSMSDEYYYLNIPIKAENKEYPCKLIIKDNRKDGKKIDSTNAKMVVSVKTINLGDVDGYLTMRENKIDVKLKCESDFTSVLNHNKSKLMEGLSSLGLLVNISVSTKDKPVDLVSCRNFFNDLTMSTIDIKV